MKKKKKMGKKTKKDVELIRTDEIATLMIFKPIQDDKR